MNLAEFLLARIAEDEAAARAALRWMNELGSYTTAEGGRDWLWEDWARPGAAAAIEGPTPDHISRHDPARVLAECEAKRRIVERATEVSDDHINYDHAAETFADDILCLLALPYADHPDYRSEWRP